VWSGRGIEHEIRHVEAGLLQVRRRASAGAGSPEGEAHGGERDLSDAKERDAERADGVQRCSHAGGVRRRLVAGLDAGEADGRDQPMTAEQSRIERLTEQEGDAQQHRRYPALASVQHLPQYSTPRHHRPGGVRTPRVKPDWSPSW